MRGSKVQVLSAAPVKSSLPAFGSEGFFVIWIRGICLTEGVVSCVLKRVKQVWGALRARVRPADALFISEHLNPVEQELFFGMGMPDQYHSLCVAHDAIRLMAGHGDVDRRLLVRCALLHDVGRRRGDVSTWDKIFTVLFHKVAPGQARAWGREGRGNRLDNLRHAVHVYFNHPQRGATILQTAGSEQSLIDVIAFHHHVSRAEDPPELILLRQADELN